jgi:xanthine dehydrogenase/oxidase
MEVAIVLQPNTIHFYVNGEPHTVRNPNPDMSLIEYLRSEGLTGTKLGCNEGGCGACTVMLSHYDHEHQKIINRSVNACLALLCSVDGCAVITVEGIGNTKGMLHMVQERVASFNGSQCGFCTPGIIMSLYTLLRNNPYPTEHDIEHCLDGNLCRCTGYRPILQAAKEFVCPSSGKPCSCGGGVNNTPKHSQVKPHFEDGDVFDLRGQKHPLFPAALKKYNPLEREVLIENEQEGIKWFRPNSLKSLLNFKREIYDQNKQIISENERITEANKRPNAQRQPLKALPIQARLIVGNSEVAIETRQKAQFYNVYISPLVPELTRIEQREDGIVVGASVTLSKLSEYMRSIMPQLKDYQTRNFQAIIDQLRWFASTPIRNACSLGGNIMTASPISDLNPLWMAMKAIANIIDIDGNRRQVDMNQFFLSYRTVAVNIHTEILESVFIPFTKDPLEFVRPYKQARRREDDIAIVNAGMRASLTRRDDGVYIQEANLAFGGMAVCSVAAKKTQQYLEGKRLDDETFRGAIDLLIQDLPLSQEAPGGMIEYRRSLTLSFFFKFYTLLRQQVYGDVPERELSAIVEMQRDYPTGNQHWDRENIRGTSVGKDERHLSAHLQVTGEAKYLDDIPKQSRELQAAFLLSARPHARVLRVDTSVAQTMPGFKGFFDHTYVAKLGGSNEVGPIIHDEELFVTEVCTSVGQILGVVVADTLRQARACVRAIHVEYEDISPTILSIKDALEHQSFQGPEHKIVNVQEGKTITQVLDEYASQHDKITMIEGDFFIGGQEHFYLEGHAALIIPGEQDELTVIASTQALTHTQHTLAHVLGVPSNHIVCKAKRIGGGFGGKETRGMMYATAAAVASKCLNRPVRLVLDRDVDMAISGQRHPFMARYRAAFDTQSGKILALNADLYSNGGFSLDLSQSVFDRALLSFDNCYHIPNYHVAGRVCKTNLPSHTAFRGFGGPQGMMVMEHILEHAAHVLNIDPVQIRSTNMYPPPTSGESATPYGQSVDTERIHRLWSEVFEKSNYKERKRQVDEFNQKNRFKKRALSVIPTKFGISFTASFLNQGGALVHIYHVDGSVLISHGGIEMGQGLHTKVAQVAASELGVELEKVFIAETSTDKVPNSSATAASVGSDLYGMAVKDACRQLRERLDKFREEKRKQGIEYKTWVELVDAAYHFTVNLSAQGFYRTPDLYMDWEAGRGHPFSYFTYGAACSQIEVDTLTGDFNIQQTDIVMDVGDSINPAIDIGQIEGAFTQGVGLFTIEELIWGDRDHKWVRPGHYFTRGPGAYKIPSFNDVPIKFNVHLLKNAPNAYAIYRSKAIGEPPLFLGATVFYALQNAIKNAREDNGVTSYFTLDSPATPERIRMSCCDIFTRPFTEQWPMRNQLIEEHIFESEQDLENVKHEHYRANGSY